MALIRLRHVEHTVGKRRITAIIAAVTAVEIEQTKQRILAWSRASVAMDSVRDADIRSANTHDAMRIFTGSATWATTHRPPSADSGLVEQQRLFMKLRTT